jgi:hypothetical protein
MSSPNSGPFTFTNPHQQASEDKVQLLINDFDKVIEAKFGAHMLKKINAASNLKFSSTSPQYQNDQTRKTVNNHNYNSIDNPENIFAVKKVINQINDSKRVGFQKYKYSSFEQCSRESI